MITPDDPRCPCGSAQPFRCCCGPLLDGTATAHTAEQLMRSRYSAYALGRLDYVRDTWHPDTRPAVIDPEPRLRWLGLEVRRREAGRQGDTEGVVEFVARCKLGGRAQRVHETSRFRFEHGRWWYVEGELHQRRRR